MVFKFQLLQIRSLAISILLLETSSFHIPHRRYVSVTTPYSGFFGDDRSAVPDPEEDDLLPDMSRKGLGTFKEQNDFLAIAGKMGLVPEEDMEAERTKARAAEEVQRSKPKSSKFDEWVGGLMAGTGQGIDAEDRRNRGEEEDENDVLVRLARRVEERRAELAGEPVAEDNRPSPNLGNDEEVAPIKKRRRKRKGQ